MTKTIALFAAAALLAGCATTSGTNPWQTDVAAVQAGWPIVEIAIGATSAGKNPAVVKAEAAITADVAALSSTVAPTNAATVEADLQALIAALPPGVLSAQHQQEITALLALAAALASYSGA